MHVEVSVDRLPTRLALQIEPPPSAEPDEPVPGQIGGRLNRLLHSRRGVQFQDLVRLAAVKFPDRLGKILRSGIITSQDGAIV